MEVTLRDMGFDDAMLSTFQDMMDMIEDDFDDSGKTSHHPHHHPSRAYLRDIKAMKSTPADVIEFPNSYQFILDMPGLKPNQIKAHIEDDNILVVSSEPRKRRETKKEGAKYLSMERRIGKMLKKFVLPDNADKDRVSAVCEDGVLTVVVEKVKVPEVKKPRVIEVKIGGRDHDSGGGNLHDTAGSRGEPVKSGDDQSHVDGAAPQAAV
ncbi:hypothetical protein OROMI_010040 [Orobanche minor]